MAECLFCSIAAGDMPATIVKRGERVIAFRDISPAAPTHVLVIPTEHHETVADLAAASPEALAELHTVAREVATGECGGHYRLMFNSGSQAGQTVFHAHGHVLGGFDSQRSLV